MFPSQIVCCCGLYIAGLFRHPSGRTLRLIVFLLDLHKMDVQTISFLLPPFDDIDRRIKALANNRLLGHHLY